MPYEILIKSFIAGILASLACGLGVLPLLIKRLDPAKHTGLGYAFAGGLMFSASVYNLILPGLGQQADYQWQISAVVPILLGIVLGSLFLATTDRVLTKYHIGENANSQWGGRTGLLIFIAMSIHSIPEGVAVGVGYASGEAYHTQLGAYIAVAIAIHNIPEGLAVAIPMRSSGASMWRCFWAAVFTSLPQPLAALPAAALAWVFKPIMPVLMGFAAGAMMFLVLMELIPDALDTQPRRRTAWMFTAGFCLMLLIQVIL
jgi:ZIP family zinc transporter